MVVSEVAVVSGLVGEEFEGEGTEQTVRGLGQEQIGRLVVEKELVMKRKSHQACQRMGARKEGKPRDRRLVFRLVSGRTRWVSQQMLLFSEKKRKVSVR